MEEIIKQLNLVNNEKQLFEKLLDAVLANSPEAIILAAKIQAGKDIRFDLSKIIKEIEKR